MNDDLLPTELRSAVNWLLDAATYARDGDVDNAIRAASRGLAMLADLYHGRPPSSYP